MSKQVRLLEQRPQVRLSLWVEFFNDQLEVIYKDHSLITQMAILLKIFKLSNFHYVSSPYDFLAYQKLFTSAKKL